MSHDLLTLFADPCMSQQSEGVLSTCLVTLAWTVEIASSLALEAAHAVHFVSIPKSWKGDKKMFLLPRCCSALPIPTANAISNSRGITQ